MTAVGLLAMFLMWMGVLGIVAAVEVLGKLKERQK